MQQPPQLPHQWTTYPWKRNLVPGEKTCLENEKKEDVTVPTGQLESDLLPKAPVGNWPEGQRRRVLSRARWDGSELLSRLSQPHLRAWEKHRHTRVCVPRSLLGHEES